MLISLIAVAILVIAFGVYLREQGTSQERGQNVTAATIQQVRRCRELVNFDYFGPMATASLAHRLRLRAGPNHRLVKAFGISNSFTSDDVGVHERFLKQAKDLLRLVTASDWAAEYDLSSALIQADMRRAAISKKPVVRMAGYVRTVCFRAVLGILLKVDPAKVPGIEDAIATATEEINVQWLRSKCEDSVTESRALNDALGVIFGQSQFGPKEGLGLIMPAYETLWRVVLLTFVSAFLRDQDVAQSCRDLLDGVPHCFGSRSKKEKSALLVAKEGLRLFPSTKRVYRSEPVELLTPHLQSSFSSTVSLPISADIESCQRDPAIWGSDADEYRPMRFAPGDNSGDKIQKKTTKKQQQPCPLQKEAHMPFGCAPHLCPAVGGFGERIIALLVTVLGRHLGDLAVGTLYVGGGDDEDARDPRVPIAELKELPTGRGDMERWEFVLE